MPQLKSNSAASKLAVMDLFTRHSDDLLATFKIKDLFPNDDELSWHVLTILTAHEDLSNIERLTKLVAPERPRPGTDEIAEAKWGSVYFFLTRVRYGLLSNIWKDILKEGEDAPPFLNLISKLGDEVCKSYEALRNAVSSCPRTKNILKAFRNQASFHYDQQHLKQALELGREDTSKIILSDSDVYFIVAYSILDLVPAGRQPPGETTNNMTEIELIQTKFHDFVRVLFLAYNNAKRSD